MKTKLEKMDLTMYYEKLDNGLGGAIFTQGNFNDIAYCEFDFNTARNGSAIYNRGSNLTVEDCNFHFNQAYSYNLFIIVTNSALFCGK